MGNSQATKINLPKYVYHGQYMSINYLHFHGESKSASSNSKEKVSFSNRD